MIVIVQVNRNSGLICVFTDTFELLTHCSEHGFKRLAVNDSVAGYSYGINAEIRHGVY